MRLFSLLLVIVSGCGTCANTLWLRPEEGGSRIYGGVRLGVETASEAVSRPYDAEDDLVDRCQCIILPTLDMPFSLVGDTLTLPWTVSAWLAISQKQTNLPPASK